MKEPFTYTFPNGKTAHAIQVDHEKDLPHALRKLNLPYPSPTLVLVGGAKGLSEGNRARLYSLFVEVLAHLAETLGMVVVDGGTDSGVMQLMAQARSEKGATFPLIGVIASGKVMLSGLSTSESTSTPLESHHTHFVLIPGSHWGDESPWIARIGSALASGKPSVTVLINGGEVAWTDAAEAVKAGHPIIVIAGSGRTADELAAALRGEVVDERARELVASGLLYAVNLDDGSDALVKVMKKVLSVP
jgi:hypothetical protein